VEPISGLPMADDIDADYTPQYVKLARILRDKIEAGEHAHGHLLLAVVLAQDHQVSAAVARQALAMLAANRYVHRNTVNCRYRVTWQPAPGNGQEGR
jgi:DNA-binding GntR family transcriptional regulator